MYNGGHFGFGPKRGFAMGGFGWTFFLFLHTSNEFISGDKPLLTFLSNLSRSLLYNRLSRLQVGRVETNFEHTCTKHLNIY